MKKITMILGFVAAIVFFVGCMFKVQHWPGAGAMITFGFAVFVIGYAPLLFLDKNKLAENNLQKIFNILVLIPMILIPLSALFKIQHWPGGGVGLIVSHILLIIYIPVFFYRAFKTENPVKKLNFFNEAILLTFIEAFNFFMTFRKLW